MQRYLTILFFLYSFCAAAQQPVRLSIVVTGNEQAAIAKSLSYAQNLNDTFALKAELNNVLMQMNGLAYLTASFTSFEWKGKTISGPAVLSQPDSILTDPDSDSIILNSQFSAPNSHFPLPNSQFSNPNSQLPTLNSQIPPPTSHLPLPDTLFLSATLNPGPHFRWIRLSRGNVPEDILSAAGFRETQFSGKYFEPGQYSKRAERILQVLENAGYPFASLKLDTIIVDSTGISASWNLEKNIQVSFDSLNVIGDADIKTWYLHKYLGIKIGSPYQEQLIRDAQSRLSQLPFLRTSRGTYVYFYGNKARPILYLENRKASSIDGIIGFAPNTQTNDGKLLVTGEANLKLQNLFSTGKSLDINYRSFLGNSQDLKIKFVYPYIFRTNIAVDYELALLKQDTTFLDVRNEIALQYRFIGTDNIRFFYNLQTTSLITVDTNLVKATRSLPVANDLRNDQYGIGLKLSRYDYFLNPRKGYNIEVSTSVGYKKILRNPTIDGLVFFGANGERVSVYDTVKLDIVQYKGWLNAEWFIPLLSRAAIHLQAMGGHLQSPSLFFSELFRIGGIRTLKGFDEQSIFASTYVIGNAELRYLLQQNSNFILFWNGAYYRNNVRQPVISDKPYGMGAGMNFETGAGIFSIFYAVGKSFDNPVEFNKAKVHFGFVNYF